MGPILMIAVTNHALDHMLCSVLDADITHKIVRLGSRSSDDRISQYSIETLEMVDGKSRLDRTFGSRRRELKGVQDDIRKLMDQVLNMDIESDSVEIMKYLSTFHPEHHECLEFAPSWISKIRELFDDKDADPGVWRVQGRRGKTHIQDTSYYAYWRDCGDLEFVGAVVDGSYAPWKTPEAVVENRFNNLEVESLNDSEDDDDTDEESVGQHSDDESNHNGAEVSWMGVQFDLPLASVVQDKISVAVEPLSEESESSIDESEINAKLGPADFQDPEGFLAAIGCTRKPAVPTSDRPLEELIDHVVDVWTMSKSERRRLHAFWVKEARIELTQNQTGEFERLHALHANILRECNEGKEEVCMIPFRSIRFTHTILDSTNVAPQCRHHRLHNFRCSKIGNTFKGK